MTIIALMDKKPYIVDFTREYINKEYNFWKNITYTDESKMNLLVQIVELKFDRN